MAAISGLDGITKWREHQTCQPEEDKNNPWNINSLAYSKIFYSISLGKPIKSRRKNEQTTLFSTSTTAAPDSQTQVQTTEDTW